MVDKEKKMSIQKRIKKALEANNVKSVAALSFDIEDYPFPSEEIAEVDTEKLRQLMGVYTAYYGHLNVVVANRKIERDSLRRLVRGIEQQFNRQHSNDKRWVAKAATENSSAWKSHSKNLQAVEGEIRVIDAQRETYDKYYRSLSREMTARDNEYEFYTRKK